MEPGENNPLTEYLNPNERLIWIGRPKLGILFRTQDASLIPFSLVWGSMVIVAGISLFIASFKLAGLLAVIVPIVITTFVLIGAYVVIGRFFVDAGYRANTFYGITNERIMILSGHFKEFRSLSLTELADVSLSGGSGGNRGTIFFGPARFATGFNPMATWSKYRCGGCPPFEMIPAANEVFKIVQEIKSNGSRPN